MADTIDPHADHRLLRATLAYVAAHTDPKLDRFREPMTNWGAEWTGLAPRHMVASDLTADALALAVPGSAEHDLLSLFVRERASRYWEQSYTAEDAVEADMLAGYGYTEIVGKRGPFVSERIRAGVGVFAAGVDYPAHRHQAEEIYAVLAGSGTFRLGDAPPLRRTAGDVIHLTPQLVHGFTMGDEPLVIFYLWQGGDLREKSTFV